MGLAVIFMLAPTDLPDGGGGLSALPGGRVLDLPDCHADARHLLPREARPHVVLHPARLPRTLLRWEHAVNGSMITESDDVVDISLDSLTGKLTCCIELIHLILGFWWSD